MWLKNLTTFLFISSVWLPVSKQELLQDDEYNGFSSTIDEPGHLRQMTYSNFYNITIWCMHPAQKTLVQVLVNDPNVRSKVNFNLPMAILIHGWMDSFFTTTYEINGQGWTMATVQAWVNNVNTNVCGIDWSDLAQDNYIRTVFRNTHIVGRIVADFVNFISVGIPTTSVTIAGHSLGAHVSGYVGKDLKIFTNQQLGRIFGLDPAGPLYTFPLLAPPENILTPDDAIYVQVIHTALFTYGANVQLGNVDFYANNAILQPGCLAPLNPGTLEFAPFLCSHFRSTAYFQSSLNATHRFVGSSCVAGSGGILDILGVTSNSCVNPETELFGIYAKQSFGRFYLRTTANYPYCIDCV